MIDSQSAAGKDCIDFHVIVIDDEVSIGTGRDGALDAGLVDDSGRGDGEQLQGFFQRYILFLDQDLDQLVQGLRGAVGQADEFFLFIELRHGTVAVTGHGHVVITGFSKGVDKHVGHLPIVFKGLTGSDVDEAAALHEFDAVFKQARVPGHVGRQELGNRHIGMINGIEQRFQLPRAVTHVDAGEAGFTGQQAAASGGCGKADQFFAGDIGAAVVGHGCLDTDDLAEQHDIAFRVTGQGDGRQAVGTCQHEAGDAEFIVGLCLFQQVFETAGNAVCTKQADNGCHAAADNDGQLGFRYSGCRTAFTAAAGNVLMDVQIARYNRMAAGVDFLDLVNTVIFIDCIGETNDFFTLNENVFFAQGSR